MSKKPRPTLANSMSAIAGIAAQRPAPETTPPVASEHADTLPREPATTRPRENVSALTREPAATLAREHAPMPPKGFNVRKARVEKPHQSIYAHPEVFRAIRLIALTKGRKPQDLYRDALRMMLATHGLDFDKLDAGQGESATPESR